MNHGKDDYSINNVRVDFNDNKMYELSQSMRQINKIDIIKVEWNLNDKLRIVYNQTIRNITHEDTLEYYCFSPSGINECIDCFVKFYHELGYEIFINSKQTRLYEYK